MKEVMNVRIYKTRVSDCIADAPDCTLVLADGEAATEPDADWLDGDGWTPVACDEAVAAGAVLPDDDADEVLAVDEVELPPEEGPFAPKPVDPSVTKYP